MASKFNDLPKLKELLDYDSTLLFEFDYSYQTAYHWAAKRGYNDQLKLLFFYGKHVNLADIHKRTPIFYAVQNNKTKTVEVLV